MRSRDLHARPLRDSPPHSESISSRLALGPLLLGYRAGAATPQHPNVRRLGEDFMEKRQAFLTEFRGDHRKPGNVSTRASQARGEPLSHGVAASQHHDRDRLRHLLGGDRRAAGISDDEVHLATDEISRQIPKSVRLSFCGSDLEQDVSAFEVAEMRRPFRRESRRASSGGKLRYPTRYTFSACLSWAASGAASSSRIATNARSANLNFRTIPPERASRNQGGEAFRAPASRRIPLSAQRPRSAAGGRASRAPGPLKREVRRLDLRGRISHDLLYEFIGPQKQRLGECQPERLGGLEVDH